MESCHILLLSNILDFEPCDFQLQRAYCFAAALQFFKVSLDCAITCTIWFEAHSRSLESPLPYFQARRELITDVRSRGRDQWPPGCLLQTVNIYSIHFSDLQLCYFYLIMFDCLSVCLSIYLLLCLLLFCLPGEVSWFLYTHLLTIVQADRHLVIHILRTGSRHSYDRSKREFN